MRILYLIRLIIYQRRQKKKYNQKRSKTDFETEENFCVLTLELYPDRYKLPSLPAFCCIVFCRLLEG